MTIDPEMLAAYADGELGPAETARVEAAIAADRSLAEQVEAHRKLRATLSDHFAPIVDMTVPDRLTAMLTPKDNIVSLAAVRAAREDAKPRRFTPTRWAMGGALAASLALGLFVGGQIPGGGPIVSRDGQLVASGALDKALTTQLASAQDGAQTRILVSFKANDGRYCRGFESGATAGVACRDADRWAILRSQSSGPMAASGGYRQAGSADADIMAAAQNMASGPALDAASEKAARDKGWRAR
jgi:hypothetical protein